MCNHPARINPKSLTRALFPNVARSCRLNFQCQQQLTMRLDYSAGEFHLEWQGSVVPLVRIILAFVVAYYAYWCFTAVDDNAVDFTIQLPEQCKKGWLESAEVLETPSIQVREHWQLAVRCAHSCVDSWLHCHPVLRPSQRQTPRPHQSYNS